LFFDELRVRYVHSAGRHFGRAFHGQRVRIHGFQKYSWFVSGFSFLQLVEPREISLQRKVFGSRPTHL
jgi:hypothetical protein